MTSRLIDLHITPWIARFMGRTFSCSLGRAGLGQKHKEGDNITPVGSWQIEYGYYRADRYPEPCSIIPFIPVAPHDGWSDDVEDIAYNMPVTLPHPYRTERLRRADTLYDYILVLNYNRDPVYRGAGSAIFLHCWRKPRYPTEGCVAFAPQDLRWIFENWDARSRVIIEHA